jgi:tRNA(fMet)-specific endonuclease VapC
MKYVLDTNIITAILKGDEKLNQKIKKSILDGESILINAISYYEIKRGLLAINATTKLKNFEFFCNSFGLLLLDTLSIFDIAAEIYSDLRNRGKPIKDADILIASIVIFNDFVLVSNDTHFIRIQNLKLENWLN